ncbi:MAG: hypothetical protein AAB932_04380 [Patescibacteria group bacterium]
MLITATDIIKKSITLYKENTQLFLQYVVLLFFPNGLLSILIVFLYRISGDRGTVNDGIFIGISMLLIITMSLVTIWVSLAFIRTVAARYESKDAPHVRDALHQATPLLWPAVWSSVLALLAAIGGFILLIIPGIILSLWFAFGMYAVALDEKNAVDALRMSKSLVQGRWWSVLWRLLAPGLVFGFLSILIEGLLSLPIEFMGEMPNLFILLIFNLLATAGGLLVAPLLTASSTILYLEMKKTPVPSPTPPALS